MKWLKVRLSKTKEGIVEKWKVALIVIGIILAPLVVWKVPEWQVRAYHGRLDASAISKLTHQELLQLQKDLITAENNARATLAQIIGGLVVLLGLYATFKNVRVAEEGKLTERFSKAVELLGSNNLDVRLGGIYALERIARDSQKDHWTVMEVLTAFVREQSRAEYKKMGPRIADDLESKDPGSDKPEEWLREDIQAALSTIRRRMWVKQEKLGQVINLSNSFLKNANLNEAHLIRANLRGANLRWAGLIGANLHRADLRGANLHRAHLHGADLSGADLSGANISGAIFRGADLSGANISGAHLYSINKSIQGSSFWLADLSGAILRAVTGLSWERIAEVIIDETTKLPPELEERRKAEQAKKAAAPNQ